MNTPRSQYEQVHAIKAEIERQTDLRAEGQLYQLGGPGSIHHKRFKFSLPTSSYETGQLPRLGEILSVDDSLTVIVGHDINPEDRDTSWKVASDDVAAMLVALACGPMRGFLTIDGGGMDPEVLGPFILQRVRIKYRYYLSIPAVAR